MNEVEKKFWARFVPESLHSEDVCTGEVCVVHNPLDHHMREWPMVWREDRIPPIVERVCGHGVGHYDFSQWDFHKTLGVGGWVSVHGCCGCCTRSTDAVYSDHE